MSKEKKNYTEKSRPPCLPGGPQIYCKDNLVSEFKIKRSQKKKILKKMKKKMGGKGEK